MVPVCQSRYCTAKGHRWQFEDKSYSKKKKSRPGLQSLGRCAEYSLISSLFINSCICFFVTFLSQIDCQWHVGSQGLSNEQIQHIENSQNSPQVFKRSLLTLNFLKKIHVIGLTRFPLVLVIFSQATVNGKLNVEYQKRTKC